MISMTYTDFVGLVGPTKDRVKDRRSPRAAHPRCYSGRVYPVPGRLENLGDHGAKAAGPRALSWARSFLPGDGV